MLSQKEDLPLHSMKSIRMNRKHVIIIILFFIISIFIIYKLLSLTHFSNSSYYHFKSSWQTLQKQRNRQYSVWLPFSSNLPHQQIWYESECFLGTSLTNIDELSAFIAKWSKSSNEECRALYTKFDSIYTIERKIGNIVFPEKMQPKINLWLGNNAKLIKQIKSQPVTHIYNEFTREHTVFNPLRAKRPIKPPDPNSATLLDALSNETAANCDFCNYKLMTAHDEFGRLESKLSATAANSFKFDQWHELVFPKTHHPINFSEEQVQDLFLLAQKWLSKVHSVDKDSVLPTIVWDTTYKSGASQIHPHIHATIDSLRYWGGMENQRLSAEQYYQEHGHVNYFTDLAHIHNALGLLASLGDAVALIPIHARKDYEVFIMSKTPSRSFFKLLYFAIRTFVEEFHQNCFSMAMVFPAISELENPPGNMPALVRIAPRGDALDVRSDLSSLELFSGSNVNVDIFILSRKMKERIEKYKDSS